MSTISCTIGGASVSIKNGSFSISDVHGQRSVLTFVVEDATGTQAFFREQEVILTDSVKGNIYVGFVQEALPDFLPVDLTKTVQEITITAMDDEYLADKRTNDENYSDWLAGDIVADFVRRDLGDEGIIAAATLTHLNSIDDFSTGILTNTVAAQEDIGTNGQLQLAPSGADFIYTESTTSDFSTGTLTNVSAINNTLLPTTTKAIKIISTLNSGNVGNTICSMKIWAGSVSIGATTRFNYDIFIDPSSPQAMASLNVFFSDGSNTTASATILNGSPDGQYFLPAPTNDLTGLATVGWYAHGFSIGTQYNGKTAVSISFDIAGTSPGTYTAYVRNVNFSGPGATTVFNTSLNVNPPQQLQNYGYVGTAVTVIDVYNLYSYPTDDLYDTALSWRQSASISIDSVKLLKSSNISWASVEPAKTSLAIYYSIGTNYRIRCTNNAPLPDLPAGLDLTGKSIFFDIQFFALSGANPEVTPVLESLTLTLSTSYPQTKTDISVIYDTQTLWNTGTFTNLIANSSDEVTLNGIIRNWDNGDFSNQSTFSSVGSAQNTANNRALLVWFVVATSEATDKLTFASTWQNFVAEVDVKVPVSTAQASMTYRQTNFGNSADSYAYVVGILDTLFQFGRGTNTTTTGAYTPLVSTAVTYQVGAWHRLKAVVNGNSHQLYVDDVRMGNVTDSTFTAAGSFGLRCYNPTGNTVDCSFDNFGVVASLSGTWVSPGTSLTSAGTYGSSVISWRDKSHLYNGGSNTSIMVEASYDNGSTYALCTIDSPLPGLTQGDSLSGKTLVIRVTLSSTSAASLAAIDNLVIRVLGSYGTVSGTRTTLPSVYDTMIGSNSVGSWPVTTDGQSYVKVGTGTVGRTSNRNTIGATTGDVWEVAGVRILGDVEATVDFSLSNSSTVGGIQLRHVDSNTFYRFSVATTGVSIIKAMGGALTTLATTPGTYLTATNYNLKFRVTGSDGGLVTLGAKIWLNGTTEPGLVNGSISRTDPQWTVSVTE